MNPRVFLPLGLFLLAGDYSTMESGEDEQALASFLGVNLGPLGSPWPWSEGAARWREKALGCAEPVHAFDLEVGGSALASLRVGFSPGQLLDFLAGWTTLDIAGDDRPAPDAKKENGDKR
ncbi:MAG: hypothetical protein ACLF0G_00735 [Candidatus Brocadiia bacterium]